MADINARIQNVAGKYTDPARRVQLRDKLLKYFRMILGEGAQLSPTEKIDQVLHQVDDSQNTFHILKLIPLIEKPS